MMIGEVDANDILEKRQWIPSILLLAFEVITIILLMNLMVSLAVGDVSELRNTAQDKLLQIKVNFVIEALQLSWYSCVLGIQPLYQRRTNNTLVVDSEGGYHSLFREDLNFGHEAPPVPNESYERREEASPVPNESYERREKTSPVPNESYERRDEAPPVSNESYERRDEASLIPNESYERRDEASLIPNESYERRNEAPPVLNGSYERGIGLDKFFDVNFLSSSMKMRVRPQRGRPQSVFFKNRAVELIETTGSRITPFQGVPDENLESDDGLFRRYCKWIIGLDWTDYLDL